MAQNVVQRPQLEGRSDSINVALNWQRLADAERDEKIAQVRDAYFDGHVTPEQLNRATEEITGGIRSKVLLDFLNGSLTSETFGRNY
jgi:hypothetical protein